MAQPDATALDSSGGEDYGPLSVLLTDVLGPSSARTGRTREQRRTAGVLASGERPEVVVAASGNLGTVWFPRLAARPTLEEVRELYPGLVSGLAATPGIGVVVATTHDSGPVAVGADGLVLLATGEVRGADPLVGYGPRAREDLLRAATLPEAADLVVVSAVTASGHVHAFEGQVGSHGGLGGEQSWPFWLRPACWAVDDEAREDVGGRRVLVGAEAVHAQLVARLAELGLRGEPVAP